MAAVNNTAFKCVINKGIECIDLTKSAAFPQMDLCNQSHPFINNWGNFLQIYSFYVMMHGSDS